MLGRIVRSSETALWQHPKAGGVFGSTRARLIRQAVQYYLVRSSLHTPGTRMRKSIGSFERNGSIDSFCMPVEFQGTRTDHPRSAVQTETTSKSREERMRSRKRIFLCIS